MNFFSVLCVWFIDLCVYTGRLCGIEKRSNYILYNAHQYNINFILEGRSGEKK